MPNNTYNKPVKDCSPFISLFCGFKLLPAVWGGTPSAVRVGHQPPPEHELFVLLHQRTIPED